MEKIDVAKILAKCPSDMELDCAMFESFYFGKITKSDVFPIKC